VDWKYATGAELRRSAAAQLDGKMTIVIEGSRHSYDFDYTVGAVRP
jgi:hypothetical protein